MKAKWIGMLNKSIRSHLAIFLLITLCLVVTSCQPEAMVIPTSTPSLPIPTDTPTPTIIWFPPTATWTPFPTLTPLPPTPEQRPGIGGLLLEDDLSTALAWEFMAKEGGSARLGKNEITFATTKKRVYLYSIRKEPVLTNFYAEITANPTFCHGSDEYGLLLRVNSPSDYYRYGVSCDGQVRLDRILAGNASSPQPWLASGSVPLGGPSIIRLGVWLVGSELRFFINDDHQFSVLDGQIQSGTVGFFARSTTDEAFTVNFRDLKIWEVNP
jgi:hypothetical protein